MSRKGLAEVELAPEDALRLQVLVTQVEAVRINESLQEVRGLKGESELLVQLHPNTRSDRYLDRVREVLAQAALDTPGGFPVVLRRWSRMGQVESSQLAKLLCLGDADAVMAVVSSSALTEELARRAWWAAPYSEYALQMLGHQQIAQSPLGQQLAQHLLEHLAFETVPHTIMQTVRTLLRPGLLNSEQQQRLWVSGRAKVAYRIPFLELAAAGVQPLSQVTSAVAEHHELSRYDTDLGSIAGEQPLAAGLLRVSSAEGQLFLNTIIEALRRPPDQEVVSALLNVIGRFFSLGRRQTEALNRQPSLSHLETAWQQRQIATDALTAPLDAYGLQVATLEALAAVNEGLLYATFVRSDAVGSLMRRKIAPLIDTITQWLKSLQG
ncbi:MAG: hypothetical protein HQL49_02435 [Gammaproteobacteria bacterium]|nr:hypothetical protein [Gammaproteobacteria bacterium]